MSKKFHYPNVYPHIDPRDEREIARREVLLISREESEAVLTPEICMEVLERAYREEGAGSAVNRTKANILIPTQSPDRWYRYCTMEGGIGGMQVAAIRIKSDLLHHYSVDGHPRIDWHCVVPGRFFGLILLFSAEDGALLAFLHDAHIQHMRVAATVALITRHMARRDASILGILGSGGMAWTHALHLTKVRDIRKILVYSPNPEHRFRFARQAAEVLGIETRSIEDPEPLVRQSDIVAACTNSTEPVVLGRWVKEGTHLVLTQAFEFDDECWQKIDQYIEYRSPIGVQGSTSEARYTAPPDPKFRGGTSRQDMEKERRWVGQENIHTLPELLLGKAPGRVHDRQITACRNEGTGVQFAAVALKVYELAKEKGLGRPLPLEWFLQDVTN
ncbi:MAG: ornithine cyclodeaminase family protein [Acidobacteria bacterium]|nr:ornithine cyclodeaminase family protein [Acidobacteriota bacterium]